MGANNLAPEEMIRQIDVILKFTDPDSIKGIMLYNLFKAEAKLSFRAGEKKAHSIKETQVHDAYEAGRKEVVEFIHKEFGGYTKAIADGGELINILIDNDYGEDGSLGKWQAKLKKWGI